MASNLSGPLGDHMDPILGGNLSYGLYNKWDQQQLSFHLAMTLLTLIILGIVYLRFVMPDVVVVKHRRNKYITSNDTEAWKQYEV